MLGLGLGVGGAWRFIGSHLVACGVLDEWGRRHGSGRLAPAAGHMAGKGPESSGS